MNNVIDDLIPWLRAQIDNDERAARAWLPFGNPDDDARGHIARYDPARVLAEVDAKRRILALHDSDHECSTIRRGVDCEGKPYEEIDNCTWVLDGDCSTVRLLALPYADRPGYRDSWRP